MREIARMFPTYFQNRPFLPLVTERLTLRMFEETDAIELARLLDDRRVAERVSRVPHPYTHTDAQKWITYSREGIQKGKFVNLAIIRRKDKAFIGSIGIESELGYWLGHDYWGQGYMKEAVKALLHFAFVSLKAEEIIGSAQSDNLGSRRIFEGNGFRETGPKECLSVAYEGAKPGVTYALNCKEFISNYNAVKRPIVWVVAAALVNEEGKLLLADRPPGKKLEGIWELPGGKLEPGETPEHALIRELKEELHIIVEEEDLESLTFASYGYETFHLIMPIYLCRKWQNVPHGAEGQKIAWVLYEDLVNYPLPPADIMLTHRLADMLKLHGVW